MYCCPVDVTPPFCIETNGGHKLLGIPHVSLSLALTGHLVFQLNISFPATGCQKLIEVDDERKLRTFYEKRMATEVAADPLGDEWKVRIAC